MGQTSTWIEPLDLFGLGRMWWHDQQGRECLTDQARRDAGARSHTVIQLPAPGCRNSRIEIEVAQDAAGRWWAGSSWQCWHAPCQQGRHTPIDAHRGATRQDAIRAAAEALLRSLPEVESGKAGRILAHWRRELPGMLAAIERAAREGE